MKGKIKGSLRAAELIAKNYSKNLGVAVRIQGTSAYTDGSQIVVPRVEIKNDEDARCLFGYIAHESGHVKYTSLDKIIHAELDHSSGMVFRMVANVLEDARIERLMGREFVGVFENLEMLTRRIMLEQKSGQTPAAEIFNRLIELSRYEVDEYPAFREAAAAAGDFYRQLYGDKAAGKIIAAVRAMRTADCKGMLKAADQIYQIFMQGRQDAGEDPQRDDEQTAEKRAGESRPENQEKQNGAADDGLPGESVKQSDDAGDSHTGTGSESKSVAVGKISGEALEQAARNALMAERNLINSMVDVTTFGRDDFGEVKEGRADPGHRNYKQASDRATKALRGRLQRTVRSYVEKRNLSAESGQSINIRKAQFIPLGETSIFYRRQHDGNEYSTSVQILVDVSGSMMSTDGRDTARYEEANIAGLSIARALQGIEGVKTTVSYFPGRGADVELALSESENVNSRIKVFDQLPRGCTPLGQALFAALNRAERLQCNRDIVVVITDGTPDSVNLAKKAVRQLQENGVEVFAITIGGFGTDDLEEAGIKPQNITTITTAGDLATTAFNLLENKFAEVA